jgi:hypothetical protein
MSSKDLLIILFATGYLWICKQIAKVVECHIHLLTNFIEIATGTPFPFSNFSKKQPITFTAAAKVISYHFDRFACRIRKLHATAIMLF